MTKGELVQALSAGFVSMVCLMVSFWVRNAEVVTFVEQMGNTLTIMAVTITVYTESRRRKSGAGTGSR